MSVETAPVIPQGEQQPTYDVARSDMLNQAVDLYATKQPTSLAEAIDIANDGQELIKNAQKLAEQGHQLDPQVLEHMDGVIKPGLDRWVADDARTEHLKHQAEGGNPGGMTDREWYNVGGAERRAYKNAARQELEVSEAIKQHKAEEALRTKMSNEKQRVADVAYDAKRAELEAATDVEAHVAALMSRHAHLSDNARAVMERGARDQIKYDIENQAAAAADQAAADREAYINANGGPAAIDTIRQEEMRIEAEAAAKKAHIDFLKRIHGPNYSNLFDEDGNNLKAMGHNPADIPTEAPADMPAEPVEIPADDTLTQELPVVDDAQDRWDRFSPDAKGQPKRVTEETPSPKKPSLWARLRNRGGSDEDKPVKPSRPKRQKPEMRDVAQIRALTKSIYEADNKDVLLEEELNGLRQDGEESGQRNDRKALEAYWRRERARAAKADAKAGRASASDAEAQPKRSLKDRAKHVAHVAGSKIPRDRRPRPEAPSTAGLDEPLGGVRPIDEEDN